MAETHNCTKGYGAMYNNCFGIRNGSIAPCDKVGKNNMCIYSSTEESYIAFRKIWKQGYGGVVPQLRHASSWTGGDNPKNWLKNVLYYYK